MKELTPMQAACLSGRAAHADLGKVAAHLYTEFDLQHGDLDAHVTRLSQALAEVGQRHAALRLRLTADGRQFLDESAPLPTLEVEDLRLHESAWTATRLLEKRRHWTHQQLDLRLVSGLRMGITLLPGQRARLHVDADMIVIDPSSFRVLMEDYAAAYECVQAAPAPGFLTWWDAAQRDPALRSARHADRQWWRARLDAIAPAPTLPLLSPQAPEAESSRLHAWLDAGQRKSLQRLAREQHISLSSLMLGLFAATLAAHTGDRRLRLNVPSFWRAPLMEGVERIVGEFANVLIVDADLSRTPSLATVCQQMAAQLVEHLAHSAWSGVDVMRELSRHCGSPQLAPVVFTAALDLPGGELFSNRVSRVCGELTWSISQGPQVALDVQVACHNGGVLLNWDVRLDALPLDWVSQLFERYHGLLCHVAAQPEALAQPLPLRQDETPLRALQQAYLLGRGTQVPLGGVAMQEFREYHGQLDPQRLRTRLADMLQRHPSLCTCIDAYRRVQYRATGATSNLDEIDLRSLGRAEARQVVDSRRESYAHAHFPLDRAPWNITLFQLPDAQWIIFARFDALIVDGRAIAALLVELLGDENPPVPAAAPVPAEPAAQPAQREADAAYWRTKLADVTGPPRLPWRVALEQIVQSRYARQRVRVPRQVFNAVARLGARQHLFKHATLTAVVLEVLSRWLRDGDLCVAMPVAAPSDAAFANRSSFLAVNWTRARGGFLERATGLQQDVMEGLQHLAFSGVDLARQLFDQHGPGPVLPVVITNGLSWPALPPEASMSWVDGLTQTPQVALDVRFSNSPEGDLLLEMDYAREALDDDCITHLLDALHRTLTQIADSGRFDVEESTVVDAAHYRLNTTDTTASTLPFLARLAAGLFDADNHATALISGERCLSYAELGQAVARAQAALAERGLVPGDVVAVCLPRSLAHTTLTLACALSGLVWVPIDAAAPAERRRYLLDNCRPALVVVQDGNASDHLSTSPDALLAARQAIATASQDTLAALSLSEAPAYYLYTSGTTGQPKCVVLNNRATANVIGSTLAHWAVTPQDVCLSVTPLHHDMSVFDVLGTLTAGATLVLPDPQQEKDAQHWHALIAQHQVSLWCSVPAILDMLLACRGERTLASLRLIAQGGDYIKPAVIGELRRLLPDARLISLGGPTETTIWSIWHDIAPGEQGQVPYGHPLPGNRYLVLDDQGRHCPVGVVGRIHTAGVNLALGYLQDGTLSQQDFVTVTDDTGTCVRAFRTGDCGRYRADGVLLFDSRVNGYVKIRGVRVSLPDVEMALAEHPALRQVLVVDYGDARAGDTCLGALYVGATDPVPSVAEVRGFARQHLQQSHVPSRLVAVAALPLSQNGKPDRHKARHLLEQAAEPAAATPAGHPVLDVYTQVLGLPPDAVRLDAGTRFVDLGLRPQHLKPLAEALRARFDVSLSPVQLLRCRDVRDVERLLTPANA